MKTKNIASILILIFFSITAIASILWYSSQPQTQASAETSNLISVNQIEVTEQVETKKDFFPLFSVVNDITVEVEFAKISEKKLEIGVCYPIPDNGDWYPTPGSVTYGAYEIFPDEAEFTSEIKADGVSEGKRCATIRYLVEDVEKVTSPINFTLIGFWAIPRETSPCKNFEQRFETNWKAQSAKLVAKCTENDNGDFSVSLVDYDKSLKSEEAQSILDEIVTGEYIGNWQFTISELTK